MLRRVLLGLVAIGALGALIWLVVLAFTSDESLIKDVVEDATTKFEELHPGGVLGHVSEDYKDSAGFDKAQIHRNLFALRFLYSEAKINYGGLKITVNGDTATAWLRVSLDFKKKNGEWVSAKGMSGGGRRMSNAFTLTLVREGWKTWRIKSVEAAKDPKTDTPESDAN